MYAASSWTRKEINVLRKVKLRNKYASFLFYFLKILTFPSQLYVSPVFGSPRTHLTGASPFPQNPTCIKKGFTGMLFFSLILFKKNWQNETLQKHNELNKKKLRKTSSSLPCSPTSADTSAGFQSNFWSLHGVYLKITSKQKWMMAGRMCFTDAGQRWKGNWAVDFGFWGCFVTLIKWRDRQTDFHCSQTCSKYWHRESELYSQTQEAYVLFWRDCISS